MTPVDGRDPRRDAAPSEACISRMERKGEHVVIVGDHRLTDEEMVALIDAGSL